MRELAQEIDSHVELVNLEITSNLGVVLNLTQPQLLDFATLPFVDVTPIQLD